MTNDDDEARILETYRRLLDRRLAATIRHRDAWRARLSRNHVAYACEFPRVMSAARFARVVEHARVVTKVLAAVPRLAFGGDLRRVARFLRMKRDEIRALEAVWTTDADLPLSRPDMLVSGTTAAVLEANIDASIGGFSHEHLRRYFAEHPVWADVAAEHHIEMPCFYDSLAALLHGRGVTSMTLLDPSADSDHEGKNLRRFLRERGIEVDHRRAVARGTNLSGAWRLFRIKWLWRHRSVGALRRLVNEGHVRFLFSAIDRVVADKQMLALLSDPELNGFVPAKERAVLDAAIPWTRLVRTLPVDFLREHRRDLVLKKGDSSMSWDVHIGIVSDDEQWNGYIKRARREQDWIVQKWVPRPLRRVPAIVDGTVVDYVNVPVDCPFMVDGANAGGLSKISGYYAPVGARANGPLRRVLAAAPIAVQRSTVS
jgi:hypothetical protein